ncbi:flagellar hook-associated protein FlgK [Sporosarcina sp. UB5]|uniref:flagellar hook-associated protein FlgK n=1 Tax=Sporosarcina sp. UB5 TaxID=3047463 RepID=UPI003D7B1A93
MRSTFMGLETNKRGLFTQQSGLYTTGHNISNANTPGYSRQRVNMQATAGFPGVGLNTPTMPGFLGTGVEAGSIQRIRDSFVDHQFRQESNKLGYWESRSKAISQMEDVLNEPSEYGLQRSLSQFWQSLQDLSVNPENGGARAVVVERGIAVADSFKYMHKSLEEIQTNLGTEIGVSVGEVNSILQQIGDLNRQIQEIEPNGYMPNDLYDARDVLIDQLAEFLPIEISYVKSGGRALPIAEGSVTIKVKAEDGTLLTVVSGKDYSQMSANNANTEGKPVDPNTFLSFAFSTVGNATGGPLTLDNMRDTGKMKSLVNAYGYDDGGTVKGLYPEMLAKLNKMAEVFITEFNTIHTGGHPLPNEASVPNFFVGGSASTIEVNQNIINNPGSIAASDAANEEGNGQLAKQLADIQFTAFNGPDELNGSTIQTYFQGVIGQLGVDGQQAERIRFNTETLKASVEHRRASISSVSLDEEMTDMIKFQQAYNASARMITVIDETLEKIINGMGVVGR